MPTGGAGGVPIAVVVGPADRQGLRRATSGRTTSPSSVRRSASSATISPPASHGSGVRALALDPSGATTKVYAAIFGKIVVSVIDAVDRHARQEHPVGDVAAGARRVRIRLAAPRLRREPLQQRRQHHRRRDGLRRRHGADRRRPEGHRRRPGPRVRVRDAAPRATRSPSSTTPTRRRRRSRSGDNPVGVAVDAVRRRVFVADYNQNAVTVIDADTLSVVGTVADRVQPYAVAVDQSAGKVFVSCYGETRS